MKRINSTIITLFIVVICNAQISTKCAVCPPTLKGVPNGYVLTDSSGHAIWSGFGGFDTTSVGVDSLIRLFSWERTLATQGSTPFTNDYYVDFGDRSLQFYNQNTFNVNSKYAAWWSNQGQYNYTYFGDNEFQFLSDNTGAGLIIHNEVGNNFTAIRYADIHLQQERKVVFNDYDTNWCVQLTHAPNGALVNDYALALQAGNATGQGFVFRDNTGQVNFELNNATRQSLFNTGVQVKDLYFNDNHITTINKPLRVSSDSSVRISSGIGSDSVSVQIGDTIDVFGKRYIGYKADIYPTSGIHGGFAILNTFDGSIYVPKTFMYYIDSTDGTKSWAECGKGYGTMEIHNDIGGAADLHVTADELSYGEVSGIQHYWLDVCMGCGTVSLGDDVGASNLFLDTAKHTATFTADSGLIVKNNNSDSLRIYVDANGANIIASKVKFNSNIAIVNGTQGTGKVLTSDANGNATWSSLTVNTSTDYSGLPQYANNAAALTGGLTAGQIYIDNSYHITVVHN